MRTITLPLLYLALTCPAAVHACCFDQRVEVATVGWAGNLFVGFLLLGASALASLLSSRPAQAPRLRALGTTSIAVATANLIPTILMGFTPTPPRIVMQVSVVSISAAMLIAPFLAYALLRRSQSRAGTFFSAASSIGWMLAIPAGVILPIIGFQFGFLLVLAPVFLLLLALREKPLAK
jgi:hypothetical protein